MERIRKLAKSPLRSAYIFLKPKKIVAGPTAIIIGLVVSFAGAAVGVVTADDPGYLIAFQSLAELLPIAVAMIVLSYLLLLGLRALQSKYKRLFAPLFYLSNLVVGLIGLFARQQYRVDGEIPEAWTLASNQVGFLLYLFFFAGFLQLVIASTNMKVQFESDRANQALDQLQKQQQLLLAGQEQARKELATYLHDGLQSSLVVIGLQIKAVLKETSVPGQEILRSLIAEVEQLRSSDVRSAMNELSPDLEGVSILASLDVLARKYAGAMQVEFDFDARASDSGLEAGHKLAIYRIVEQALLNAARHGKTKSCLVSASISDQKLALVVAGPGLPVAKNYKAGVGLSVIDGWCKVYGGSWKLTSNDEATALAVTLKI